MYARAIEMAFQASPEIEPRYALGPRRPRLPPPHGELVAAAGPFILSLEGLPAAVSRSN